jgi:hypothetical protein
LTLRSWPGVTHFPGKPLTENTTSSNIQILCHKADNRRLGRPGIKKVLGTIQRMATNRQI